MPKPKGYTVLPIDTGPYSIRARIKASNPEIGYESLVKEEQRIYREALASVRAAWEERRYAHHQKRPPKSSVPEAIVTDLECFFDAQLDLVGKEENLFFRSHLLRQRKRVIEKALGMGIGHGRIPFLAVVPSPFLSIYTQMGMHTRTYPRHSGDHVFQGSAYINTNDLEDAVETPKDPYFIFDVDDGLDHEQNCPPNEALVLIKARSRQALTTAEIMALGRTLSRENIVALASRRKDAKAYPLIWSNEGWPNLQWLEEGPEDWQNIWRHVHYPSCGARDTTSDMYYEQRIPLP